VFKKDTVNAGLLVAATTEFCLSFIIAAYLNATGFYPEPIIALPILLALKVFFL